MIIKIIKWITPSIIKIMNNKTKTIILRVFRSGLSGFISGVSGVTILAPKVWSEFTSIFFLLGIAGAFGLLTGLIAGLDKWARWDDEKQ